MDIDLELNRRLFLAGLGAVALRPEYAWADATPISAKIVVEDSRLWVGATIGASEPLLFIIDTGAASNFIEPAIAARLKLTKQGGGTVGGVGGKLSNTGIVEARDVVISGAMRQPTMQFQTYGFNRRASTDGAGLFSAGLVTAYDSDLSFSEGRWTIWPKGRAGQPAGTRLDNASITALGGRGTERIYVTAQIDGQPYKLMVDTGAPRGLLLFPRATAKSGLLAGRPTSPVVTTGFGGSADKLSHIVRAKSFALGPLAFDRPFVTLMDPDQSIGFNIDGLLGLPLITMFDWSTDVGTSRLWVTRNATGLVADRYSRSGLWFDKTAKGGAVVASVGVGSPAAAAGIQTGDEVVEPARFADAVKRINGPVRQAFSITIKRGAATTTHQLTPLNYL
jgi:Aspartyl protease